MPSRLTKAIKTGERGLAERTSLRPFGPCMTCTHWCQPLHWLSLVKWCAQQQPLVDWHRCRPWWCAYSKLESICFSSAVGLEGILSEASSASSPKRSQWQTSKKPKVKNIEKSCFYRVRQAVPVKKKKKKVMQVTLAGYNLTLDLPLLKGSRAQLHL